MRKASAVLLWIVVGLGGCRDGRNDLALPSPFPSQNVEILVVLQPGAQPADLDPLTHSLGGFRKRDTMSMVVVSFPSGTESQELIRQYEALPIVRSAALNLTYRVEGSPPP